MIGTAGLGGVLLFLLDNSWWLAAGGALSLFGGAFYLGRSVGDPEPLYGTLLAAAYVGVATVLILGGTLLALLPDPWPGLEVGDSTFFFVSPLLLLLAGALGSMVGGRMSSPRPTSGPKSV
jgi:hypothetical protein